MRSKAVAVVVKMIVNSTDLKIGRGVLDHADTTFTAPTPNEDCYFVYESPP